MPIILLRGGSIVNQAFDIGHMMHLINRLYYPNGAKVEDAPRRSRHTGRSKASKGECRMLLRSSSHLHASFGMLLCTQEPEMGCILLFVRTAAFPKGKQNGEKKEHLYLINTVDLNQA